MCSNPEIERPHTLQVEMFLHVSHLPFEMVFENSLDKPESLAWVLDIVFSVDYTIVNLIVMFLGVHSYSSEMQPEL